MRKKQHKKIDGRNRVYDKFYLINYLEPGKTWEEVLSEDDQDVSPQSHDRSGSLNGSCSFEFLGLRFDLNDLAKS